MGEPSSGREKCVSSQLPFSVIKSAGVNGKGAQTVPWSYLTPSGVTGGGGGLGGRRKVPTASGRARCNEQSPAREGG